MTPAPSGVCDAGPSVACACPDGGTALQLCRADGTFTDCSCGESNLVALPVQPRSGPGVLTLGPGGVVIVPKGAVVMRASLRDVAGTEMALTGPLEWSSSAPTVATVDSGGRVTGVSPGVVSISVTDAAHHHALAGVAVAATLDLVPSGPVGIDFAPSMSTLRVAQTTTLTFSLSDAAGAPITDAAVRASITLRSSDDAIATIDTLGNLTAVAPGVAQIVATRGADARVLIGRATIVVLAARGGPGRPRVDAGTCQETIEISCFFTVFTAWFSQPGLSGESLRVGVFRTHEFDNCTTFMPDWTENTEETPQAVAFAARGVVSVVDGRLHADWPGQTRVTPYVDGVACQRWSMTRVDIDWGGDWFVACDNTEFGCVSLGPAYRYVDSWEIPYTGAAGARSGGARDEISGTSAFHNYATPPFMCTGPAQSQPTTGEGGLSYWSDSGQCSSATPCSGAGIGTCASSRHEGTAGVSGPDSFDQGDCEFFRMAGACTTTCQYPSLGNVIPGPRAMCPFNGCDQLPACADGWASCVRPCVDQFGLGSPCRSACRDSADLGACLAACDRQFDNCDCACQSMQLNCYAGACPAARDAQCAALPPRCAAALRSFCP